MDPIVVDCIKLLGYEDAHYKTKRLIVVKTPNLSRVSALKHISAYLNAPYDSTPCYLSSIGYVKFNDIKIIAKPIEKQGDGSAGKYNEKFLIDKLNTYINSQQYPIVIFESPDQKFAIKGITAIEDVSNIRNNKRHKTDIKIHTAYNQFNLSVKKNNAEIWESADSYAGRLVRTYVENLTQKGLVTVINKNGINAVSPNIAIECNEEETKQVIFGEDLELNGGIIINTFDEAHFKEENDILFVKCNQIIKSTLDLKEYQKPYFLIRNDCTRNCGYKGIRVLACYKSRIKGNMITFPVSMRID